MTCNTCNECNPCEKENKPCCELKVLAGDCVDVEEVNGAYVVSATCPPEVAEGDGIEVEVSDSPREGYSKRYTVSATDKKVAVCSDDKAGYLNEKLRGVSPIEVNMVGCGTSDGYMEISLDEDALDTPDEKVAVTQGCRGVYLSQALEVESDLIESNIVQSGGGCVMRITDKGSTFYDNNVCLGFTGVQDFHVAIDGLGNSVEPKFATWNIFTGNPDLATQRGILIKEDGYYRIFGQLTVQNNIGENRYINLGRGLLRIDSPTRPILSKAYLSTAKHGEYTIAMILKGGSGINIDNNGTISVKESGGEVDFTEGTSQDPNYNEGPWMTFNMDAYVDLRAGDLITVGYRPQTDMPEGDNGIADFRFVGLGDDTSEYQSLFGGACIGVQMIAPKTFNGDSVVERIRNA